MNNGKARDYFSAFYEGSLDRGLQQAFELRLKEDAQLQAEYRAFERTMKELEGLSAVEIEPPADLHERISARLDRHIYEQKRQATPAFAGWWKSLLVGTAAAAGFFFAVVKLNTGDAPQVNTAGLLPTGPAKLQITPSGKDVLLSYPSGDTSTIVIRDGQGAEIQRFQIKDHEMKNKPLKNEGDAAQLVQVEINQDLKTYIALPGKVVSKERSGSGSLGDLAKGLAGFYSVPVVLEVKSLSDNINWDFTQTDPLAAAHDAVRSANLKVEQRKSGAIYIQES
jgi:hypothetical protein